MVPQPVEQQLIQQLCCKEEHHSDFFVEYLSEFKDKLKVAGIEKAMEEIKAQVNKNLGK